MKKRITTTEFAGLTSPLLGLPVSYTWQGIATAIFLEFGRLNWAPNAKNPKGEFCLDLEWGWRIEKRRSIWFGSDSDDRRISSQLPKLLGARARGVSVYGRLPEIQVNLDDRFWLTSFTASGTKPEWALFLPDGTWCHVVNGVLYQEDGNRAEQRAAQRSGSSTASASR